MQTPLEFLDVFRSTLRSAGITFAVTSGMACIRYGLQQTTKDSDWIVAAEDLPKLRSLLQQCERRMPPWVVQYRAWALMPDAERDRAIATRPLLSAVEAGSEGLRLEFLLRAERIVWEAVNRHRQAVYQNAWKDWYRRWQATGDWPWPVSEPFSAQHERIVTAARDCGLPPDPLAGTVRHEVYAAGLADAAMLANIEEDRLTTIAPPIEEVLP